MELEDFVKGTLVQVFRGVEAARNELSKSTGTVSPRVWESAATQSAEGPTHGDKVHYVDFDVAVTAASEKSSKGGIAVVTALLSVGAKGSSRTENEHVSRIKFSVPVVLPHTPNDEEPASQVDADDYERV